MNSIQDIWTAILDALAGKLTTTSINTWFSDCQAIELDDGRLVLQTSTEFKKNIIQQRFSEVIQEALRDLFSYDFDLLVLSGDEAAEYLENKKMTENMPDMKSYTFENFIVGSSNKFAHAAALGVVNNPGNKAYNPLFIYGNSGLGKTHLLLAIGAAIHANSPQAKIMYVKGDDFLNDMVQSLKEGRAEEFRKRYRYCDLFLVDDIQFIAGREGTQEEFFHTFNNIYESGHQIVITSDRPPLDMAQLDDRLRTRFEGGLMADVQTPDVETRMAIIRNKAGHLGLILSDNMVEYIAQKITSNIRQIEGVVKKLAAYRNLDNTLIINTITIDKAIADVIHTGNYVPTPDEIVAETARYYQVSPEDICGLRRSKTVAMARHISVYLIRTQTNMSLNDIGKYLGRDHATIMSSERKITKAMQTDNELSTTIRDITSNLNARK